jgi:FKBP-type peptidyl-prolyl cis-trans isomerase
MPGGPTPGTWKSLSGGERPTNGAGRRAGSWRRGREGHFVSLPVGFPPPDARGEGNEGQGGPHITMKKIRIMAALAATALLIAACGGSSQESEADKFAQTAEQQAKTQATLPAATTPTVTPTKATPSSGESDIATKPKIPKSSGPAPKNLKVEDLIEGKGAAAKSGDKISVRYVGTLYDNGKEFDSSWKRGKAPFQLTLGQGQVIQGWDQGLVGMKVGGRRRLTIPPDLAYGAQGQPPTIPANSTLVFDVDLTKIG